LGQTTGGGETKVNYAYRVCIDLAFKVQADNETRAKVAGFARLSEFMKEMNNDPDALAATLEDVLALVPWDVDQWGTNLVKQAMDSWGVYTGGKEETSDKNPVGKEKRQP
jgi:hypothetical protein